MPPDTAVENVLDMRGEFCPKPIIEMAKAVKVAAVGGTVEMWADDPVVEKDVRAWSKAARQKLLMLEKVGAHYVIRVEKIR